MARLRDSSFSQKRIFNSPEGSGGDVIGKKVLVLSTCPPFQAIAKEDQSQYFGTKLWARTLVRGKMGRPSDFEEKRKQPRVSVRLAVNLRVLGQANQSPGVTGNASQTGLLINTFRNLYPGEKIIIEVLTSGRRKASNFTALTQIIWKDIGLWDDWEGYVYGLRFVKILEKDYLKLKELLLDQSKMEEVMFVNKSDEEDRLVIRTKL